MSYQEELLIRIRSAYESGGFSSLSADMSKAKDGYTQVANTATNSTSKLAAAGTAGTRSGELIAHGATTGEKGLEALAHRGESAGHALAQGAEVGAKALDKVSEAGSKAGSNVAKGGQVGAAGLNNISRAGSGAISTLDGLNTVIGGIVGGFGLMTVATAAWSGSSTAEFNKNWLATKVGTEAANQYVDSIGKIVSEVPGDDSFMNQLLTGAVTKQTNLSTNELTSLGSATADYLTESQRQGKSSIETQMDLKEYIQSGNTTQLERDSILKQQIGTLEGQGTVSERILALNKALTDEGLQGISATQATALTWEEVKGKLQASATTLGTKFLPYINQALNFLLAMDDQTGGLSTQMILIAGGAVALVGALGLISGPIKNAVGDAKDLVGWIKDKIPGTKTTTVKCVKDPSCTGTTSTSSTTTTSPSPVKSAALSISSLLIVATAAAAGGAALKFMNDVLGGTHQQLMNILNLSGGTTGTSMGGLFGAMIMGEGVSLVDILQQGIPIIGIMITSFTTIKGIATGLYGALSGPFQSAYSSIISWWGGLPAWFGGLGAGIGKQWDDIVNYFNDKGTIGGQIYEGLKKIYCIIVGCSPGIIPALQMLYLYALFVFNSMVSPVMTVKNTIQAFVLYILLQMTLLQNDIITKWNLITAIVGVWINTGIAVVTDGINWAIVLWNQATGTISIWVGTGVSVATNAIQDAINWWEKLKATVGNGINTVINIVQAVTGAGSPSEVDYLYGQGSYYESDYTPIITSTTAATSSISTTTTKTVISPIINIESIDSKETADYTIQKITKELSDLNDSKGR